MSTDRIILQGMIFFGYHGTRPEEATLGQRFEVDVELHCDLRAAGENDDLTQSVDYSQVYQSVRALVEGPAMRLTEALAERIAATILQEQARVQAVCVRIRKPWVRLEDRVLTGSVIEIQRSRYKP